MLFVVSNKNWSLSRELQLWKLFASFFVVIVVGWFPTKNGVAFSGLYMSKSRETLKIEKDFFEQGAVI